MIPSPPKRPRGRPSLPNALSTAERSKRYRDRQRLKMLEGTCEVLRYLYLEIAKPVDPARELAWKQKFDADCERIDREFSKIRLQ